ncbi:hypothetical protein PARU111607_06995 [Palleronia rufa]
MKRKLGAALSGETDHTGTVETGSSAGAIVAYQREVKHDVIVLRSHNPGIQDFFPGSTDGRIVRRASCSAHVIR